MSVSECGVIEAAIALEAVGEIRVGSSPITRTNFIGELAHLVERLVCTEKAWGSNPQFSTRFNRKIYSSGFLL